jgi:DNA-binding NarL/FixJ family response regulator
VAKDIRVLIIEDDPYAQDLMSLLLTRDWRTRVVAEVSDRAELENFLAQGNPRIDVIVLDTEMPGNPELPFELAAMTQGLPLHPKVLYTATKSARPAVEKILQAGCGGFVLKSELLYALGAAVSLVADGQCVITPGIQGILLGFDYPSGVHVLDGRKQWVAFTPREREIIRLAMIFNLAIRDMADELVLSAGWVSEVVSMIYLKLGLREILTGEAALEDYFSDENVLAHCRAITQRGETAAGDKKLRKAPWMSTLAFHLLTIPEVEVI